MLHPSPPAGGTSAATGAPPATTRSRRRGKRGGRQQRAQELNARIQRDSDDRRAAHGEARANDAQRLTTDLDISFGKKREMIGELRAAHGPVGEGAPLFRGRLRVTNRSGRRFYATRCYDLAAGEVRRIDWHRGKAS